MQTTGKRIIEKILAIAIILIMTMADICLLGERVITYAIDQVQINSNNVGYNVYFVGNNKTAEVTANVNQKDLKLGIEVSVKNDGYLENGKIELEENANFKFIKTVNSDMIKSIEDKAIYLKQINEGENIKLEIGIEFANAEEMSTDYLSKETIVKLTGSYTNSKNVNKDKIAIEGNASVRANWKSPNQIQSEQKSELLTNSLYTVDGIEKRIVQTIITSNIKDNSYPVKNTKIEVLIPNSPEKVTVNKRTTSATNGDRSFRYNYEDGKLTIIAENGADNKISWIKNAKDIFVVTTEYAKETEITNSKITINSNITTYDEKELKTNKELIITGEKDEISSIEEIENQANIGKGKIFAGEEKSYLSTSKIYIDYAKAIEEMTIEENTPLYVTAEEEKEANAEYVQTSINKSEFITLFGEDGTIDIYDRSNNLISTINGNTTDENGKLIVKYEKGVKALKIITSKPIAEGTLKIENEKRLLKTNYTREQIQELTQIKDTSKVTYTKTDSNTVTKNAIATITLKETESKASLEIEPTILTTSQDEHKLTMRVILETNGEDRDLYKNPVIKLTLPNQITSISANYNLINANGLTFDENGKGIKRENDKLVITIPLKGEQTSYLGEAIKGTELLIEANVKLNKLATNSEEEIVLNYTNENATKYVDSGVQKVNVKIQAQDSIILTNDFTDENEKVEVETIGKQEDKEIQLNTKSSATNKKIIMRIANNEDADISDVKVIGKIANITGKITRTSGIRTNKSDATIYYTTVDNPTEDINNANNKWTKTSSEDAKNYLIILNTLKKGDYIRFSYDIEIKKDLPYNLSTQTGYKVSYKNTLTGKEKNMESTNLLLTTGKVAEIKTSLIAEVGGEKLKEGDKVKAGEIITYTATISNTGREKAEGLNITATIPDDTTLIEINPKYPTLVTDDKPIEKKEDFLIEKSDKELVKTNATIEAQTDATYTYMVRVNSNLDAEKEIEAKITAKQGEKEQISTFKNKIEKGQIRATLMPVLRKSTDKLSLGEIYTYALIVENITDNELKNVQVTINKNEALKIKELYCVSGEDYFEHIEEERLVINIPSISAKSNAIIEIDAEINQSTKNLNIAEMSASIKDSSGNSYRTNKISSEIIGIEAKISLEASIKDKEYVRPGEGIEYTIKVKNTSKYDENNLEIHDRISDYLELKEVTLNNQPIQCEIQSNFGEGINYNTLIITSSLKTNEEAIIKIKAKVDNDISTTEVLKIINRAFVYNDTLLAQTDEKVHYIRPLVDYEEPDYPDEPDNPDEPNDPNEPGNGGNGNEKNSDSNPTISGTVWKDMNQNGSRDSEETPLEEIKVYAINVKTNKIIETATTNSEGFYTISLPQGEYIIAFEYDTEKYIVTTYQAEDVSADTNSDAIKATKVVDGEERTLAFTDSINLRQDEENIDLGLAEAKVFSLDLEKVISKIIVTNNKETKTYNFEDKNLAKVEIPGRNLNNSNVVIEYKFKVTNTGEIPGYAKSIVDYIPASLGFNSSLNSEWYKKGNNIYTSALADVEIQPGETKEITLTLTKKMTESNTGLTNNKAEIESSYNSLGIKNSASENKSDEQISKRSADAIIGVSTGATVSYVTLTLAIIIIICGVAYLINKNVLMEKIDI